MSIQCQVPWMAEAEAAGEGGGRCGDVKRGLVEETLLETLWDEEEFSRFMRPGAAVHAGGKQ